MGQRTLLFPGQASQEVGMAKDIYDAHPSIRKFYKKAKDILGYDIAEITFEGPIEKLTETQITQPAIFIASVAYFSLIPETYNFKAVAGHSLGEFSALYAAGVLSFDNALKIVKVRAEGMQQAGLKQPGTMAAILNMKRPELEKVLDHASLRGIVSAANFNSPGQIVISGEVDAVRYAMEVAKRAGALKAIELQVSGAFHSALMSPAKADLVEIINSVKFHKAKVPVYANYTAKPTINPKEIADNLIYQLENPVLWEDTINQIIQDGGLEFVEVGPGRVLQGLMRRINRKAKTSGINKIEDLEKLA